MASLAHLRPLLPKALLRPTPSPSVSPLAVLLVVLALAGIGGALLRPAGIAPATPSPAPIAVPGLPRGDLPIIGDPIRDLTIWWSNRLTDANRAGLDSLRGRALTPIDPIEIGRAS